jgi:hypothetical protein
MLRLAATETTRDAATALRAAAARTSDAVA